MQLYALLCFGFFFTLGTLFYYFRLLILSLFFFLFFFYLLGTVRSIFRITGFPYSIHIYIRLRCLYFFKTHIPWSIFFCSFKIFDSDATKLRPCPYCAFQKVFNLHNIWSCYCCEAGTAIVELLSSPSISCLIHDIIYFPAG